MEVSYNARKNAENIRKHGISLQRAEDFDIAAALFDLDDSQDYGEVRHIAIGWIGLVLHTLVFTIRHETVHAISLRKATREEQRRYAKES
jgi:hypothetical protein